MAELTPPATSRQHLWVLWSVLAFILVLTVVFVAFRLDITVLVALIPAATVLLKVAYGRDRSGQNSGGGGE